jgi:hypothetical protein
VPAAGSGSVTEQVTGLVWRHPVSAQVFEEAAVDLSRALAAYRDGKTSTRKGRQVGFPKRKGRCRDSFRLRNKRSKRGSAAIRVGEGHPRCVVLPRIGTIRVHDDTRRLRRLLRPMEHLDPDTRESRVALRAWIMFATVSRHGSRWYVTLNLQAWQACDGDPERLPGPSPAHVIERWRSGGYLGSTLASQMCGKPSSMRSPASSSRPTIGGMVRLGPGDVEPMVPIL